MLKRIVQKLRGGREARRNRVWVVFIDENGPLLLSPDYFKRYCPEEDQLSERGLANAALRLGTCLMLQPGLELTYLKRFALKGGSRYKDLHVFYAVLPRNEKVPKKMTDFLSPLRIDAPQQREVKESLEKALASNRRYLVLQLQASGILSSDQ